MVYNRFLLYRFLCAIRSVRRKKVLFIIDKVYFGAIWFITGSFFTVFYVSLEAVDAKSALYNR